jgi:uncharacterized membrane protein YdjX (TVP38/TMEM64 family)
MNQKSGSLRRPHDEKARKQFFFEKKNQKTFIILSRAGPATTVRAAAAVGLILLLAGCFVAARLLPAKIAGVPAEWLALAQAWGRTSWIAFVLLQSLVAVSGVLPASLAGVAAGAVFGLLAGFWLAALSTMAGAVVAFALSRSVFRPWVAGFLARRAGLQRLDEAVAQDGWRSVCLLRLSPVMPFAVTSYALGLTSIGWRDYLVGTLASMPALFCYVALGRFAGGGLEALHTGGSPVGLALLAFGLAATAVLTLRIGALVRRTLGTGPGV